MDAAAVAREADATAGARDMDLGPRVDPGISYDMFIHIIAIPC